MIQIPETPLFSAADEVSYARTIEAGVFARHCLCEGLRPHQATTTELEIVASEGEEAWRYMYQTYLGLAAKLARRWAQSTGASFDDLFQEACLMLGECLQRWDYRRGVRFVTMAWRNIDKYLASAAMIAVGPFPDSTWLSRVRLATRRIQDHLTRNGVAASAETIAEITGFSLEAIRLSMRGPIREYPSEIATEEEYDVELVNIRRCLSRLSRFDRMLLQRLYGIDTSPRRHIDIARELDLSESSVRRLERRALASARALLDLSVAS